jgi:hypothetical protein
MNSFEQFHHYRPRVGEPISYKGELVGHVTRVEGSLCFRSYPDGEPLPFIWCFNDGLNALHDWPSKAGGKIARCPGVNC